MKTLSKLQQLSFIIRREFLAISTSYAVLLVLMGGIFVYGLLYNYMYAPNIVTDVPVAVVDNSHSELSRDFIRWLDATPQAEIFSQAKYREYSICLMILRSECSGEMKPYFLFMQLRMLSCISRLCRRLHRVSCWLLMINTGLM